MESLQDKASRLDALHVRACEWAAVRTRLAMRGGTSAEWRRSDIRAAQIVQMFIDACEGTGPGGRR